MRKIGAGVVPARSLPPATVASSQDEETAALKETVGKLSKQLAAAMARLDGFEREE